MNIEEYDNNNEAKLKNSFKVIKGGKIEIIDDLKKEDNSFFNFSKDK